MPASVKDLVREAWNDAPLLVRFLSGVATTDEQGRAVVYDPGPAISLPAKAARKFIASGAALEVPAALREHAEFEIALRQAG